MAECQHEAHTHSEQAKDHGTIVRDPVCGMKVNTRTAAHRYELGGTPRYFCSARCLDKFKADPDRYLNSPELDPAVTQPSMGSLPEAAQGSPWTCPMHPEIQASCILKATGKPEVHSL